MGDARDSTDIKMKIQQIGLVKNMEKLPPLIIREPLKFCSAVPPRMIPKMIADMENWVLFRKYPRKPKNTMTYTSVIE